MSKRSKVSATGNRPRLASVGSRQSHRRETGSVVMEYPNSGPRILRAAVLPAARHLLFLLLFALLSISAATAQENPLDAPNTPIGTPAKPAQPSVANAPDTAAPGSTPRRNSAIRVEAN